MTQGNSKLISSILVQKALNMPLFDTTGPLIIGLDIARFGDDETVFCFRRGRLCIRFETYRKKDTVEVANITTHMIKTFHPERIFLDIGGQGAGVYDILKDRGFRRIVRGVYFGEKAISSDRYVNRRAEMWDHVRLWLSETASVSLPKDDTYILGDLTCVNKKYDKLGRLQLEEKDSIKRRLGRSPDRGDALALTFAEPVFETQSEDISSFRLDDLFAQPHRQTGSAW